MNRLLLYIALLLPAQAYAAEYKYCECGVGSVGPAAHELCQPGTGDASNGDGLTLATTRIRPTLAQINAAQPGDRFRMCNGGKWPEINFSSGSWSLLAATHAANPVIIENYTPATGLVDLPILTQTGSVAVFTIGNYIACYNPRGGYTIRNLHLQGATTTGLPPANNNGLEVVGEVRNITFEGMTITGFRAGAEVSAKSMYDDCSAVSPGINTPYRQYQSNISHFTFRNNLVDRNYGQGLLLAGSDTLLEDNTIRQNNYGGNDLVHGIYYTAGVANYANERVTVRGNLFDRNSVVEPGFIDSDTGLAGDGITCRSGTLTMRQMWGARIENNVAINTAAKTTCYGFTVNIGYSTAELHRDVKMKGNTSVNPGGCGICFQSVIGAVAENNTVVTTRAGQTSLLGAISMLPSGFEQQPSVRFVNNSVYAWAGTAVWAASFGTPPAASQVVANNAIMFWGSGTRTAFEHDAKSTYAVFDYNLVFNATRFSPTYPTIGNENNDCPSGAASFDCNGIRADPQLVAVPSEANGWRMVFRSGGSADSTGTNLYCSKQYKLGRVRTGVCSLGSYKPAL